MACDHYEYDKVQVYNNVIMFTVIIIIIIIVMTVPDSNKNVYAL